MGGNDRQRILKRRAAFISASLSAVSGCCTPPPPAAAEPVTATVEPSAEQASPSSAASASSTDASADAGAAAPDAASTADAQPRVVVSTCLTMILRKVQFDRCSSRSRAESRSLLSEIADVLAQHPEVTAVAIDGDTDSTEGACGAGLGERRARQVKQTLISLGVDPTRLCVEDPAGQQPLAPNHSAEGRKRNRRVDFRILAPEDKCNP